MTTVSEPPSAERLAPPRRPRPELAVSRYDNVSAMLIALLVLVGITAFCLLVIWFTSRVFAPQVPVPVQFAEIGTGNDDTVGDGAEIDEPTQEEISEEADVPEPQIEEMLAVVETAVASVSADLTDPNLSDAAESGGEKRRGRKGTGKGRPQRWQVSYLEATPDLYARQLDYFKIELGAFGGGSEQIFYASNFSQAKPTSRTGKADDEKRVFLAWRQGNLREADEQFMVKAGLKNRNLIIAQFLPPDLAGRLAQMEQQYQGRTPSQIRLTRFGVRPAGDGFEFYVLEQLGQ